MVQVSQSKSPFPCFSVKVLVLCSFYLFVSWCVQVFAVHDVLMLFHVVINYYSLSEKILTVVWGLLLYFLKH